MNDRVGSTFLLRMFSNSVHIGLPGERMKGCSLTEISSPLKPTTDTRNVPGISLDSSRVGFETSPTSRMGFRPSVFHLP